MDLGSDVSNPIIHGCLLIVRVGIVIKAHCRMSMILQKFWDLQGGTDCLALHQIFEKGTG